MSFPYTPLTKEQQDQFNQLRSSINEVQTAWLAGYLAALTTAGQSSVNSQLPEAIPGQQEPSAPATGAKTPLTILFGSRTGNGQSLANQIQQQASANGFEAKLKSMTDYKVRELQNEKNLLVVVSTHGEGEAPFEAKEVYDFIHSKRAPKLNGVQYAVLGLGDSSYFHFCKTGKDFDAKLAELGAHKVTSGAFLDVNFKDFAGAWINTALGAFGGVEMQPSQASSATTLPSEAFSAEKPLLAEVLDRVNLNGRGSDRQTIHLELATPGLSYEVGDAAGIISLNTNEIVNEVLRATTLSGDAEVEIKGAKTKLSHALKANVELSKLTLDVLQKYQAFHPQEKLNAVLNNQEVLKNFLYGRDVVDLLRDYPVKMTPQQLIDILRPLQPRLYSISSSPNAMPDELHLTVGVVEYENRGRLKKGTCSNYLADLDVENQKISVFIEKNPNFRLPKNPQTPIIMVGAGTGIAPFRAFVQERELQENAGDSWLFFGNRNFETEFLYQTEWQQFLKSGALSKLDLAFSRDSDQKVYVQHKLLENADEVYRWLQQGAHFYICGDRVKLAGDVQAALLKIIVEKGNFSIDEAQEYLNNLQKDKRLQLDVY